jgi:hypothetical protein
MNMVRHRWEPRITAICLLLLCAAKGTAADGRNLFDRSREFLGTVKEDYTAFYLSPDRAVRLGVAFGAGGLMANTSIDENIQGWYQERVRTGSGDEVAKVAKVFGEALYVFPVAVAAMFADDLFKPRDGRSLVGVWGERASRAYLVGAPGLLLTQWLTGGSRPTDGNSHWRAFADDHGVSGHAFVGAVPFLTLARMSAEGGVARYGLYALSTLPAWSRINDNAHFASQAFLGWFLAWEATGAILQTSRKDVQMALAPVMMRDGYGVGLKIQW